WIGFGFNHPPCPVFGVHLIQRNSASCCSSQTSKQGRSAEVTLAAAGCRRQRQIVHRSFFTVHCSFSEPRGAMQMAKANEHWTMENER
ncbi:MAG: hypothetical protein PSU94_15110, partial [Lacunisphaera sp.]|nr:hypothetical protein [Lacunisphaera sp.]